MRKLGILVTGAALAAVSMTAQAAIHLNATRAGNFVSSAVSVALPLNDARETTLSFNLAANKKLVLSYSAECLADEGTKGWVDIDIVVNGKVVAPTVGTNDIFCSFGFGDGGVGRVAITVQIQGIAGSNTVRIIGRKNQGLSVRYIGDSALVVFD